MKFTVQWNALEKRQLLIFALVAFGVPYLMGIAMGAGFYAGSDVSVFPNAQMFYPAAGVMLALLVTKCEHAKRMRKGPTGWSFGCKNLQDAEKWPYKAVFW